MEFEDQEPHEGDTEMGPSYDSISNSNSKSTRPSKISTPNPIMDAEPQSQRHPRYRECLKNHAVGIGAHAVDGCGEFLPSGPHGTLDALKCAACNCHRNFHRKESLDAVALTGAGFADPFPHSPLLTHYPHVHHHQQQQQQQFSPTAYFRSIPAPVGAAPAGYLHVAQRPVPLALPSTSGGANEQEGMNSGGEGSASKKRYRTKFTAEQKERMVGFAEGLGWRIQKQDEEMVQQFCNENGLKRHVLKVWMHNNKHTIGKKP